MMNIISIPYLLSTNGQSAIPGANFVSPTNLMVPFLCPATMTRSPISSSPLTVVAGVPVLPKVGVRVRRPRTDRKFK